MIKSLHTGRPDPILWITFAISVIAVSVALFTEFYLGFIPCHLCIYERLPYLALGKISFSGLIATRFERFWKICALVTIFVAICLSGYHAGVERGIIAASAQCNAQLKIPEDISDVDAIEIIYQQPIASCTTAPFKILFLSMTEWNLVVNILLFIMVGYRLNRKSE